MGDCAMGTASKAALVAAGALAAMVIGASGSAAQEREAPPPPVMILRPAPVLIRPQPTPAPTPEPTETPAPATISGRPAPAPAAAEPPPRPAPAPPVLQTLGKQGGMLGAIFYRAQNKIQHPAKLSRLVQLMDAEEWINLDADTKGDLYECLLQKTAAGGG